MMRETKERVSEERREREISMRNMRDESEMKDFQ